MTKSYEELVLGNWNFDALVSAGQGYGMILDGFLFTKTLNGVTEGRLYLPDQPATILTVTVNGPKVTLSSPALSLNAEGFFRGPNVITGTFTSAGGAKGEWVISRGDESITNIKGDYTFEAAFNTGASQETRLDGILQLDQPTRYRLGASNIATFLTGNLNPTRPGPSLRVTGAANGGQVFFVLEKGGQRLLATETRVTKNVLEGTLYGASKAEAGTWKATLRPTRPDISTNWALKAQIDKGQSRGTKLIGALQLNQAGDGQFSGTFTPAKTSTAQPVQGTISPMGAITFTIGVYKFSGNFAPQRKRGAYGVFVNTTNHDEGNWGVMYRSPKV